MAELTVKIIIVDDSLVFRHAVQDALRGEPGIEVVGSARNGVRAMELISSKPPDLVTLDLEMPEMDGVETLKAIQAYNARHINTPGIGVIMLSAHTKKGAESTIMALEAGAFDFVTKPAESSETESIASLKRSLLPRIHHFASMRALGKQRPSSLVKPTPSRIKEKKEVPASRAIEAVVIGVSTGGPKALGDILPQLSELVKLPILIVQHMPEKFTQSLAESLAKKCSHKVKEGENGEVVDKGTIYIAPGGRHMMLRLSSAGPVISLSDQPAENGCRPSVDVLFRSLPAVFGSGVVAVIMTGMGNDGSNSLRALKRAGVSIIAQDEASSVVWGMPGSAVSTGFVDEIVSLMDLPQKIATMIFKRAAIAGK